MAKPKHTNTHYDPLPDLPDYDPAPADGVRVGESPVPGLTLRRILRGHKDTIGRIAWSPDGRFLASPSKDKTIRIWDVARGKCVITLNNLGISSHSLAWSPDSRIIVAPTQNKQICLIEVSTGAIIRTIDKTNFNNENNCIAWSPSGDLLAIGSSFPHIIQLWDTHTWKLFGTLEKHDNWVNPLLWLRDSKTVVSGSWDKSIKVWNVSTKKLVKELSGHDSWVCGLALGNSQKIIFSCGDDKTIRFWDTETWQETRSIEGHTSSVTGISLSNDERVLASKSQDNTIRIWNTTTWSTILELEESFGGNWQPSLAFHPDIPRLATLGEEGYVIRIWDLDMEVLLGQTATDSVRYTTAKLVLVGDSGVGKTGLGWRLAHGAFKEHASSHGQQFWVIDNLCTTRADGTECEAVLWDLAGQAIYRHGHPLFLENVDLSLLLFDPTKGMESLDGVEFWINQLSGKDKLPPSVLVGARVDVGDSILTPDELVQFCQRYGISGGYVRTSAKEDIGLDQLMAVLQSTIPWDGMTTTVTTVTFKRIKDYVLSLKEQPDRANVLVSPAELREQLVAAWKAGARPFDEAQGDGERADLQFTDAEMMTAVGHLENHGYVTILRTSAGAQTILLAPDLLVNLVSSIVLQASRHPRSLGSLNETTLLTGGYPFAELEALSQTEQETLSDAAILRFLEHNICFRETLGAETLLIFPGLIRQKRPLYDEVETSDDVSYVVRGAVENIYAALVVLLGYTQTFTRVNQWQNQAQYEMGAGEICGFRQIEERAGEIELILYYAATTPAYVRTMFQGLFEKFLYQRDVDVTRYPPVRCVNGHLQERATVIKHLNQGRDSIFCPECGEKVTLPKVREAQALGERDRQTVARAENLTQLRRTYEMHLSRVKGFRRDRAAPRCYVSHLPAQASWVAGLVADLREAGVHVVEDPARVEANDFILLTATPAYKQAWQGLDEDLADDMALIQRRLKRTRGQRSNVIPLLLESELEAARPQELRGVQPGDFRDETRYLVALYDLVLTLYAIPFNHPAFEPLRESLYQQWEQTLARLVQVETSQKTDKIEPTPREDATMNYYDFQILVTADRKIRASSEQGDEWSELQLEMNRINLALGLIEQRQTNTQLLKGLGRELYQALFPTKVHGQFRATMAGAEAAECGVRLRLVFESPELAALPWEFLYDESTNTFLANDTQSALSRYIDVPLRKRDLKAASLPLKILLAISGPTDLAPLDAAGEEGLIREALAKHISAGQIELDVLREPTIRNINQKLREKPYNVFHFIGHGVFENDKGFIALVDQDGKAKLLDDEGFANFFLGNRNLGLAVLNACQGAAVSSHRAFAGIAPHLVRRGIPAVVAMQYSILDTTAKLFADEFYRTLALGWPVDAAIQTTRNAISIEMGFDWPDFGTPVLYMRAKDGVILSSL